MELVKESNNRDSRREKFDMQLLTRITVKWMELMIDRGFPPLTPHHTQALVVLMMSSFFELYLKKGAAAVKGLNLKAFIAQMSTGEGKSIVIAMMAIFMVELHGMRVHVLENNAGLMERDYRQNKPFYDKFGIASGMDLDDPDVKICYCLKAGLNKRFLKSLVAGTIDDELAGTVLIVDEVDDLIVNERPNAHYVKKDSEKTPAFRKCYAVLKDGGDTQPEGVEEEVWDEAQYWVSYCDDSIRVNEHYRLIEEDGKTSVVQLDTDGNVPKVKLTSPWLQYMSYKLCGIDPETQSRHSCVCTPYMFNKYQAIFGLTGSVGGKAELNYLRKTYQAVKFDVPRFLDTCIGDARKEVTNHGVEIVDGEKAQAARVVEIAKEFFRRVPVLVIASSTDQLDRLVAALQEAGDIPSDEVQRFAQFDQEGKSLASEWQTIIDDATRRLGGAEDNRCRVTVTDRFGGRGHDFQVVDREANANGGMLVVATSMPDEREWIQWKGRTARQDRPGQVRRHYDMMSPYACCLCAATWHPCPAPTTTMRLGCSQALIFHHACACRAAPAARLPVCGRPQLQGQAIRRAKAQEAPRSAQEDEHRWLPPHAHFAAISTR